jgi:hypothetical protein
MAYVNSSVSMQSMIINKKKKHNDWRYGVTDVSVAEELASLSYANKP